jgi:hypothetical protein
MKTMTISKWSSLALAASVLACELPLDQLEVGDETYGADEDTGTDSSCEGEGGDGDGEALLECVGQGTNLAGGDEPIDFPLPECEVVCATGWGHGAVPLANAWTLDLEHGGVETYLTYLEATPTGELVAVISSEHEAARLLWVSPEGELLDELTEPAIDGEVSGVAITDDGNIVVLWRKTSMAVLTALSSSGQHLWTVDLGLYGNQRWTLAALGSGVLVALYYAMFPDQSDLVHVDSKGVAMGLGSIPHTTKIAVAPSGNTMVVAHDGALSWIDLELFPNGTTTQGLADALLWSVDGLVALDDERAVIAGSAINLDEDGYPHAFVGQIGPMGLEWEGRYDRALEWCGDDDPMSSTTEHMWDVERLADGSLLVVGSETGGGHAQPWVAHVSAQGEVLATDRGFWNGRAATVASSQDAAYVLMFEYDETSQQHIYLRKYLP